MRIEKILGCVVTDHVTHSVAKLENGRYVVGSLISGQIAGMEAQFDTVTEAFEHWVATLPELNLRGQPCRPDWRRRYRNP